MELNQLLVEEVNYELQIRVKDVTDKTLIEKMDILSNFIEDEPDKEAIGNLNPNNEYLVLRAKVAELHTSCEENSAASLSSRLPTLYLHVVARMQRVMFNGSNYEGFVSLSRKLKAVRKKLVCQYPALDFPLITIPRLPSTESEEDSDERESKKSHRSKKPKKQEDSDDDRDSRKSSPRRKFKKSEDSDDDRDSQKSSPRRKSKKNGGRKEKKKKVKKERYRSPPKYSSESSSSSGDTATDSEQEFRRSSKNKSRRVNPVTKWTFRFGKDEDLEAFLDDVEEAAQTHDVEDEELLRGIGTLLTGAAKLWYRSKKTKITSWKMFKNKLRDAFRPEGDDDEVLDKINGVRQKSDETFAVYEARIEVLFRRLHRPLSSQERLRKVKKGLDLYYRRNIKLNEIDSLRELRKECERLEPDKSQILKLEKEARKKHERKDGKEERRDGRAAARAFASEANATTATEEDTESVDVDAVRPMMGAIQCWRCGRFGHISIDCTTNIFCVNCGEKDVVAERCPNCARASQAGLWNTKKAGPSNQPSQENSRGDSTRGCPAPWTHIPPPPMKLVVQPSSQKPTVPTKPNQNQNLKK